METSTTQMHSIDFYFFYKLAVSAIYSDNQISIIIKLLLSVVKMPIISI